MEFCTRLENSTPGAPDSEARRVVLLRPQREKLWRLLTRTMALLSQSTAEPRQLASIVGLWTWICLPARLHLSIFNTVYAWLGRYAEWNSGVPRSGGPAPIWESVRNELNSIPWQCCSIESVRSVVADSPCNRCGPGHGGSCLRHCSDRFDCSGGICWPSRRVAHHRRGCRAPPGGECRDGRATLEAGFCACVGDVGGRPRTRDPAQQCLRDAGRYLGHRTLVEGLELLGASLPPSCRFLGRSRCPCEGAEWFLRASAPLSLRARADSRGQSAHRITVCPFGAKCRGRTFAWPSLRKRPRGDAAEGRRQARALGARSKKGRGFALGSPYPGNVRAPRLVPLKGRGTRLFGDASQRSSFRGGVCPRFS